MLIPRGHFFAVKQYMSSVREMDMKKSKRGVPMNDLCRITKQRTGVLHSDGSPYPGAAALDEKAIDRLTAQKHNDYPELVASDRVHFVVRMIRSNLVVLETTDRKHDLPGDSWVPLRFSLEKNNANEPKMCSSN